MLCGFSRDAFLGLAFRDHCLTPIDSAHFLASMFFTFVRYGTDLNPKPMFCYNTTIASKRWGIKYKSRTEATQFGQFHFNEVNRPTALSGAHGTPS